MSKAEHLDFTGEPVDDAMRILYIRHRVTTVLVPYSVFHSVVCLYRQSAADCLTVALGMAVTIDGVRVIRQDNGPSMAFTEDGASIGIEWGPRG